MEGFRSTILQRAHSRAGLPPACRVSIFPSCCKCVGAGSENPSRTVARAGRGLDSSWLGQRTRLAGPSLPELAPLGRAERLLEQVSFPRCSRPCRALSQLKSRASAYMPSSQAIGFGRDPVPPPSSPPLQSAATFSHLPGYVHDLVLRRSHRTSPGFPWDSHVAGCLTCGRRAVRRPRGIRACALLERGCTARSAMQSIVPVVRLSPSRRLDF